VGGAGPFFSERGTAQWTAPEVGSATGYDARVDVYSLAIVLWELTTGLIPYDGISSVALRGIVTTLGARPPVPFHAPRAIAHLIRAGWHADPNARPSASAIARVLQRMVETA
jgi:serine/threonine protein kinase